MSVSWDSSKHASQFSQMQGQISRNTEQRSHLQDGEPNLEVSDSKKNNGSYWIISLTSAHSQLLWQGVHKDSGYLHTKVLSKSENEALSLQTTVLTVLLE